MSLLLVYSQNLYIKLEKKADADTKVLNNFLAKGQQKEKIFDKANFFLCFFSLQFQLNFELSNNELGSSNLPLARFIIQKP